MCRPSLVHATLAVGLCLGSTVATAKVTPMRPLPVASERPLAKGPGFYVDPVKGDDKADGSAAKPWKTISKAVTNLKAGDTLYLHGGTYFEAVTVSAVGTSAAPITIRSAPGELAVIDGGLREFVEKPKAAWEPAPGGAKGEFRSTATYPKLDRSHYDNRGVFVVGNFADSMVPLHGYRLEVDLRSDNPYWNLTDKLGSTQSIYVGPGVWFDWSTQRIHVRLVDPTNKGELDPRNVPLVIGIDRSALRLEKASNVRIQDLVLRGSAVHTVDIASSDNVELDNLTIYGGSPALYVRSSHHLRLLRSNLRGLANPTSTRASMKYRGNSPYLFIADSKLPQSHDWEFAYNEFTDSHDGLVIDSVKTLRFHHNRLDNFNDDGIYLTLPPRESVPEDIQIYENLVTRTTTVLAFAEESGTKNTVGSGVYIYRNVFDLRDGTAGWPAKDAASALTVLPSRMCGDHGAPAWEPMMFYQNTVIGSDPVLRNYYGEQMIMGGRGPKLRLFNNIFIQIKGDPGLNLQSDTKDAQVDGNLLWGVETGPSFHGDFFTPFRSSAAYEASKNVYPPGWTTHDVYADPKLTKLGTNARDLDARLDKASPAVDAGIKLPKEWPDSLRAADKGNPDIGAMPLGSEMLRVGPAATR